MTTSILFRQYLQAILTARGTLLLVFGLRVGSRKSLDTSLNLGKIGNRRMRYLTRGLPSHPSITVQPHTCQAYRVVVGRKPDYRQNLTGLSLSQTNLPVLPQKDPLVTGPKWFQHLPGYLTSPMSLKASKSNQTTDHALRFRHSYYGSMIALHANLAYPWISVFLGSSKSRAFREQVRSIVELQMCS
jgi:hypothetical protein